MNNLNRKLILIATSALALTASTGFLLQTEAFNKLKGEFSVVFKENEKNKKHLQEQALTIHQLGEVIKVKEDSISFLNVRIGELVQETNELKGKIRSLDQKVQQFSTNVNSLTKEISSLKSGKTADQRKINSLVTERDELLKQMEIMDKERSAEKQILKANNEKVRKDKEAKITLESTVEKEKVTLEKINEAPPAKNIKEPAYAAPAPSVPAMTGIENEKETIIASFKQNRMKEILTATKIEYKAVSLRDEKNGKDLDKVNDNGWRYTLINFDLANTDPDAIYDEDFIIQIFDVDNQRVVPFNESNPGFPDSNIGSTGHKFTYEGKPLEIAYFNSQKKTGKNYEVRLYYAGKGFLLPIKNGNYRIVEDGKVALQ